MNTELEQSREDLKNSDSAISKQDLHMVEEDLSIITRGVAEIITLDDLTKKLIESKKTKKPLKIKLGIDPTAPHIHLGFAVVLRKMRKFQDLGHRIQLLIGDFTARVGDPTGRSETRKVLTPEEIEANAKTYREQLSLILDPEKTDVRFNSEWLGPMDFGDILKLTSKYTVARILERDDFNNRMKNGIAIGMHEILYPLMQGYDSVALGCDIEMGGTDQKFNILVGRDLQREYGQPSQVVFLMPILEGTDGVRKMSKSYGNYIGITEEPNSMFGKIMSIPDNLLGRYFELCTDIPLADIDRMQHEMENGAVNPRDVKMRLGEEIIAIYHDREKGKAAREEFIKVFSRKEVPTEMPEVKISCGDSGKISIIDMLISANMTPSKREARRLLQQGAVKIDGEKVSPDVMEIEPPKTFVLQSGSRKFAKFVVE